MEWGPLWPPSGVRQQYQNRGRAKPLGVSQRRREMIIFTGAAVTSQVSLARQPIECPRLHQYYLYPA